MTIATQPPPSTKRPRLHETKGFTLIELMIAMVVSAIVILGVFAFSSIQQSTAAIHERNVRVQQALEGAMWTLSEDVRHAGLGFSRLCTELRVWDPASARLVNPGAVTQPSDAAIDPITLHPYWALRDGLQGHWNSDGAESLQGSEASSSSTSSAADSFDVLLADANYLGSIGVFTLVAPIADSDDAVRVRTSALMDNTNPDHLTQVQQLFPPGSFIVVGRTPAPGAIPFRAENHGQCMLLQITAEVEADGADTQTWRLPIGTASGFNANLAALVSDSNGSSGTDFTCPTNDTDCDDWQPGTVDNIEGSSVLPLGSLRWSRYEIDYTIETLPYLVRYDIIGFQQDVDPDNLAGIDYPHCSAGQCPAPQLHLPGGQSPPRAVAVGPMIEDMQIAVGCDGYTVDSANAAATPLPIPDDGFAEVGPAEGSTANQPNGVIDENDPDSDQRNADEWLGNAITEEWAPDCVWYGTAEYHKAEWVAVEGDAPPPPFRMSPQTIRITLVGAAEGIESGGLATANVPAVEDRPVMGAPSGVRQRWSLTERFTPKNLRWRDPTVR